MLLYIIYSKSAKITLSVCVAVSKFVCDVNGGKPVLSSLCMFKTVRLPNRSWFNLERSHVFSLLAIGMLDEPRSLTSKDGLSADRAKIRTYNSKRNNNFMIFQKSRLKLIHNLFQNRLIN